jgi:hypothetical protein
MISGHRDLSCVTPITNPLNFNFSPRMLSEDLLQHLCKAMQRYHGREQAEIKPKG